MKHREKLTLASRWTQQSVMPRTSNSSFLRLRKVAIRNRDHDQHTEIPLLYPHSSQLHWFICEYSLSHLPQSTFGIRIPHAQAAQKTLMTPLFSADPTASFVKSLVSLPAYKPASACPFVPVPAHHSVRSCSPHTRHCGGAPCSLLRRMGQPRRFRSIS